MSKYYIGIDNGVTGSMGILHENGDLVYFQPMLTKSGLSYTKSKTRYRTRIDHEALVKVIKSIVRNTPPDSTFKAFIERPMINNFRFFASISASASLEATLVILEQLGIGYEFCDSRGWQKELLPKGITGEALKPASRDIGIRMFPQVQGVHIDCDGLLIAEWARRNKL